MAPQAKRRKTENAIEEISFDPDARHEFLTGFHKRKLQRIKQAQEYAAKRAREEKREERRKVQLFASLMWPLSFDWQSFSFQLQIREQRAAEIEQALNESKRMLEQIREDASSNENDSGSDEEEWQGFEEPAPVDYEEEYIDEDKYTTVTVEEMGVSKDALLKQGDTTSSDEDEKKKSDSKEAGSENSKAAKKPGSKSHPVKKKKKQFRYESKEERKLTRMKQRTARRKKAESRRER